MPRLRLATLLQITGHETFTAHDGPTALVMIASSAVPTSCCSISPPPRLNGYEVCRRVRNCRGDTA